MNEKTSNIIETMEKIREQIDKKKNRRTGMGTGECLACGTLTDDLDDFTCGHPQCDKTLKEEMSARKDLLKELGVNSINEVVAEIRHIRTIADEIKSKL